MSDREIKRGISDRRYRWFKFWLALGAALAILMLVNSVLNYTFVTRRIVVEQLRRELNKQVAAFEHDLRPRNAAAPNLAATVEEMRKDHEKILWVEVRDRDNNVLVRSGMGASSTFSAGEMRSRMRNREPLFKLRDTSAGEALVEAFPIRLPAVGDQRPPFGVVEMAMSLDSASAVLWPVRRNLIINVSAALALLVALVLIGVRFKQYVQGKQLEQQLEIARKVQQGLLPSPESAPRQVKMAAECIPALGVGGDFYDAFETGPDRVGLVLGDVSGKGMPAALLMGVIHGAVRSAAWTESEQDHEDASRRINRLLLERASGERYASMFWAYYDAVSESLNYINAGHCAPFLIRKRGGPISVTPLNEGGPVLGLLAGARYSQETVKLEPGDLLVMYSDGVVEATNAAGEEFGEERLRALLESQPDHYTPDQIHKDILAAVNAFSQKVPPHDDLTLMVVRFEPSAASLGRAKQMEAVTAL